MVRDAQDALLTIRKRAIPPRKICKARPPICVLRFGATEGMLLAKSKRISGSPCSCLPCRHDLSIEQPVDRITDGMGYMRDQCLDAMEAANAPLPTLHVSPAAVCPKPQQTGRYRLRHYKRAATHACAPGAVRHGRLRLPFP